MDPSFLEPGFDPKNLTVAQLRRILVDNNVHLPSKVKKAKLVTLFHSEIVPKLDELRGRYKDVKPSSKGIRKITRGKKLNLEDQNSNGLDESSDNNNNNNNNNKKKKKKRKRDSMEEEKDDDHIIGSDIQHNTSTDRDKIKGDEGKLNEAKQKKKRLKTKQNESTQVQLSMTPETTLKDIPHNNNNDKSNDDDGDPLFIKSSSEMDKNISEMKIIGKQTMTPDLSKLKVSPEFAVLLKNAVEDKSSINEVNIQSSSNPFTSLNQNDNTLNAFSTGDRCLVNTNIGPIDGVINFQNEDSTKLSSDEVIDIITDSEDDNIVITKDTDVKIKQQDQKNEIKQSATVQSINKNEQRYKLLHKSGMGFISFKKIDYQRIRHLWFNIIMFTVITSVVLFILWYREQRIRIGYCDVELSPQPIVPAVLQRYVATRFNIDLTFIDDWLHTFNPKCLPCPDKAICFPNMTLTCKTQYRKIVPLLSLNNLIPLSPYCIPDIRKIQFVDTMFNKFVKLLRKQNGAFNCGKGTTQKRNSIPRSHLHDIFAQNVDHKKEWTQDEVAELWNSLLKKLGGIPEIEIFNIESNDGQKIDVYVRSTSQDYSSLWCKYGNQIKEFLKINKLILVGFIVILFMIILMNSKRKKRMAYKKKIEKYVNITVEKLGAQTGNHKDDNFFLHTLQIRDSVLVDVVDLNERKKIWKDMVKVLKDNKEIVSVFAEINGEILECWSCKGQEEN